MRRRLLILLAAVLAIVAGGSAVAWQWAAQRMQARLAAWEADAAAQGWTVTHQPARAGGWPFAVELTLPGAAITGLPQLAPGGVAWSAARVVLRVGLPEPRLATLRVEGAQRLRLGTATPLSFQADRFMLTTALSTPARDVAFDAGGLRVDGGITVGLLQGLFAAAGGGGISARLSAEAISFPPPPAPQPPFGDHIASAIFEGALTGPLPVAGQSLPTAVAAWQAAGGSLSVSRFALGWGPLGASGEITAALDAALQPVGSAQLHLVGFTAALQALTDARLLAAPAARAAGAVLSLMATTPPDGGSPTVTVPLELRDRTLSMGHIPLAKLPRFDWSAGARPGIVDQ